MASAAAAPSSACIFSTTAARRHLPSLNSVLKATCGAVRVPSLPDLCRFSDQISIAGVASRSNLSKITPAVVAVAQEQEAPAEAARRLQNTKLYFGNLPYHCDGAQLTSLIQDYASPLSVEVLYDKDTGGSRGFAFVTMSSTEACEAVISSLNGTQYEGRKLRVKFPEKWKGRVGMYQESEFKLFVGNLSWSVTSETLKQVFKDYGSLVGARVLYDSETGRSRGYGFVCYSNNDEMTAAMESLNEIELEGRALRISLAIPKKSPSIGDGEGAK
ncbi:hypothetical protein KSP39_PZI008237 [Platanthera zijinensis]|uniref:RRM domain-containing protein n=1 Tax=Platanthera zijinensis TaxID=2320716 RepID=A0AAP0BMU6_9ASPA